MRRTSFFGAITALCLLTAACTRAVSPLPAVPTASLTPAPAIELPRDALPHDVLTEWWYFTGHLRSATGQEYGFEFTVFQARRQDAPTGYLAHFAVSDIDGQRFSHQLRVRQGEATGTFPIDVSGWTLASSGGVDSIRARMTPGPGADPPFEMQLDLVDEKPPALHHGGYIDYGAGGGSYYYSRTRLRVSGSLDGVTVRGLAWMDHQWGDFVVSSGLIWDWYSLQLDDRTELMLYVLRGPHGETTATYGSRIATDGSVQDVLPGTVRVEALGSWSSPHTGGVYPSGWRLTLPAGEQLELRPRILDQELYFPDVGGSGSLPYWEGAVSVSGDRSGVGYVELTGYAGQ